MKKTVKKTITSILCHNCAGKGYNTRAYQLAGANDLPDHEPFKQWRTGLRVQVIVCSYCQRGKDIKKHFNIKKRFKF